MTSFGCTAFALLFDDIEPGLSETDRSVFQSFGSAQVSVTNEVYQHLGQPQFYFCPTGNCQNTVYLCSPGGGGGSIRTRN